MQMPRLGKEKKHECRNRSTEKHGLISVLRGTESNIDLASVPCRNTEASLPPKKEGEKTAIRRIQTNAERRNQAGDAPTCLK